MELSIASENFYNIFKISKRPSTGFGMNPYVHLLRNTILMPILYRSLQIYMARHREQSCLMAAHGTVSALEFVSDTGGCTLSPTILNIFLERIMFDSLVDREGEGIFSIGERLIRNFRFAVDIIVKFRRER